VKDIHDVILRPVISEKSYEMISENKYTFIVDRGRTRPTSAGRRGHLRRQGPGGQHADRRGKVKQRGVTIGKRPDTKRAIVTVAPGDRIELFDAGI
jgi:large subunit ribosomal protein L23